MAINTAVAINWGEREMLGVYCWYDIPSKLREIDWSWKGTSAKQFETKNGMLLGIQESSVDLLKWYLCGLDYLWVSLLYDPRCKWINSSGPLYGVISYLASGVNHQYDQKLGNTDSSSVFNRRSRRLAWQRGATVDSTRASSGKLVSMIGMAISEKSHGHGNHGV